jgi:predicted DNA-binding transcriptional regulator AlpA
MTTGRGVDEKEKTRKRYLTEREVEENFNLNRRTLQRWRMTGEGPAFSRIGKKMIRYLVDDVESFFSSQKRHSTCEYPIRGGDRRG